MEQTALPTLPPFPEDATVTNIAIWVGNFLLWVIFDPRVRDVVVGVLIPLIGQIVAVTFGEVLKMYPRMVALKESRIGEWKFYLRTGPIIVGAIATFMLLYNYYDLEWSHAGSWMLLALLNGAAAWPVFDRVVEPHILPWVYAKLSKWSGKPPYVAPPEDGDGADETIPQRRLRELNEKLGKSDTPPEPPK